MEIKLTKKPKSPTIIEGFPGFGLVGTIATEFLVDHLKTEQIGKMWLEEMPAMAAIHDSKMIEPLSIQFNKKNNLVLIHGIAPATGFEWKIAEAIIDIARQLNAKRIISIEGISSPNPESEPSIFFFSKDAKFSEKLKSVSAKPLKEGIVVGVTGALLIRSETVPVSCLFSETSSNLPDARAAASIIQILDSLIDIDVDYKPLIKQAEKFEDKLKTILQSSKKVTDERQKKQLSYMG